MASDDWRTLLTKYKLGKREFLEWFDAEAYDEPEDWQTVTDDQLRKCGFRDGHMPKWRRLLAEIASTKVVVSPYPDLVLSGVAEEKQLEMDGVPPRKACLLATWQYSPTSGCQNLPGAQKDAVLMTKALTRYRFGVTEILNGTWKSARTELRAWCKTITNADDVAFYAAGHGIHREGTHRLLPTDFDPDDVEDTSISLDWIVAQILSRNPRVKIFMIDCCAEYTVGRGDALNFRGITRSIEKIMGSKQGLEMCCIVMSKGTTAFETDNLGFMTEALVKHMEAAPNITTLFQRVRGDLVTKKATDGRIMVPETKSTLTSRCNDWAFNPAARKNEEESQKKQQLDAIQKKSTDEESTKQRRAVKQAEDEASKAAVLEEMNNTEEAAKQSRANELERLEVSHREKDVAEEARKRERKHTMKKRMAREKQMKIEEIRKVEAAEEKTKVTDEEKSKTIRTVRRIEEEMSKKSKLEEIQKNADSEELAKKVRGEELEELARNLKQQEESLRSAPDVVSNEEVLERKSDGPGRIQPNASQETSTKLSAGDTGDEKRDTKHTEVEHGATFEVVLSKIDKSIREQLEKKLGVCKKCRGSGHVQGKRKGRASRKMKRAMGAQTCEECDGSGHAPGWQWDTDVTTLNLGRAGLGDPAAAALAELLPYFCRLQSLNLGPNDIGNEGCVALAEVLPTTLKTLYMQSNSIGPAGARALAARLPALRALELLYLRSNRGIDDEDGTALAAALPPSLKELYIHHTSCGDRTLAALADQLHRLQQLTKVCAFKIKATERGKSTLRSAWEKYGKPAGNLSL